jgi:HEAT repeat protein
MGDVQGLIEEYATKIAEAATRKQIEDVFALHKEFEAQISSVLNPIDGIAKELKAIVKNKHHDRAEMWLIAALLHPSPRYLEALCAILEQEEHFNLYNGVIDILQVIGHERVIPCLQRALTHHIDYDAARDLSINTLTALGEIGTPAAISVVEGSLSSQHKKIREDAQLVLKIIWNQSK